MTREGAHSPLGDLLLGQFRGRFHATKPIGAVFARSADRTAAFVGLSVSARIAGLQFPRRGGSSGALKRSIRLFKLARSRGPACPRPEPLLAPPRAAPLPPPRLPRPLVPLRVEEKSASGVAAGFPAGFPECSKLARASKLRQHASRRSLPPAAASCRCCWLPRHGPAAAAAAA
eukprot:CAMPEP_0206571298 /NCGR_PEP_ID=MMETSP0325_2-20121206/27560_1 /ASSEMBLY_ACC=CAM_ASM_000347 /TAXON_ID=2866 /ORGANISM="Crypthecodinium cohnii, Strain Seligo" /LENGTH=173 /DNA_ID=CAMNT_0054075271 /DNA_START=221 /DNA_END=740 /DNA_ORIENTATION=-